jgi:hypothetical protein
MNIDRILASTPINQTAARVVSSSRNPVPMGDLSREELIYLRSRLERKLRLLKQVLKITSKAQHKNLMHAINSGRRNRPGVGMLRLTANPRTALEYKRVGEEMQRMQDRIRELRLRGKAEQRTASASNGKAA